MGGLPYSITEESLLQLFAGKGYKPVSARVIADRETGRSKAVRSRSTKRVLKNPVAVGTVPVAAEDLLAGVLAVVDVETIG